MLPDTEGYDKERKHGELPGSREKVRERFSTKVKQMRESFNVQIAHLVVIIHAS